MRTARHLHGWKTMRSGSGLRCHFHEVTGGVIDMSHGIGVIRHESPNNTGPVAVIVSGGNVDRDVFASVLGDGKDIDGLSPSDCSPAGRRGIQ